MSSFIVSKREYVKAAGLMYGIEESKRDPHRYFLDNVRKEFEHAYVLNVASVNEQYGDSVVPDGESYDVDFECHRRAGDRIYDGVERRMSLEMLRPRLQMFFQSVLYQIENEAAHRVVAELFYECTCKLYEREIEVVDGWWGDVQLSDDLADTA